MQPFCTPPSFLTPLWGMVKTPCTRRHCRGCNRKPPQRPQLFPPKSDLPEPSGNRASPLETQRSQASDPNALVFSLCQSIPAPHSSSFLQISNCRSHPLATSRKSRKPFHSRSQSVCFLGERKSHDSPATRRSCLNAVVRRLRWTRKNTGLSA